MTSALDATTPREVWLEYEAMKRVIEKRWSRHRAELDRQQTRALDSAQEQLGCGVPPDQLTDAQRAEW
jgi:hypothetical protein